MKDPFYGRVPYNLMVVRMSSLGDIVHTLPAYRAIHERYPKTRIHWLVEERYQGLIENLEGVEPEPFNKDEISEKIRSLEGFWEAIGLIFTFVKRLRKLKLVFSIVFQPLLKSTLLARLSGSRVRIGFKRFAEGGWFFLTHRFKVSKKQHMIKQNLELLKATGIDTEPARIEIPVNAENKLFVEKFLSDFHIENKKYMVICPAASTQHKQWTTEGYAELADKIAEQHQLTPILTCYGEEISCVKEIVGHMKAKYIIAEDFNLQQLAFLLKQAAYVVAPDTGPLHMAAAMGSPVVGLYGPTDPAIYGPFWEPNQVVSSTMKCKKSCERKSRKKNTPCKCMKEIDAAKVFKACEEIYQ